ncbi:MAG: dihydroneopterin aldolase [Proteiniphilum sp.]
MRTKMTLRNMHFYAYHGAMSHERIVGGDYRVTLQLEADLSAACVSDELDDTINYAGLFDLVKSEMEIPSQLIEHVAGRIHRKIKEQYSPITSLTVTVVKLHPPVMGLMEAAEITLTD